MSADRELLPWTRNGPLSYVDQIRRKALRDDRRSLYSNHDLEALLKFISRGRHEALPRSPSPDRAPDAFAWVYELRPNAVPAVPRHLPTPDSLSAAFQQTLPPTSAHGDLLLLRGYPSSQWLVHLGWYCGIEEELWRQHLDFLEPSPTKTFSYPQLPSFSGVMLRLRITTIGLRDSLSGVDDHVAIERLREDAARAMNQYSQNLRVGKGWRTGDSIVRGYHTFDSNHFSIEQRITIYLNKVEHSQKYWRALILTDCGEDLAASPHGPWLGDTVTRSVDRHTLLVPLHRYLQNEPDAASPWTPNNNHSSSDQVLPDHGFTQNAGQMHLDYGRTLDHNTLCADPLYAMSDVFMLVAIAESKFLNLIAQMLDKDSEDVIIDDKETDMAADKRNVFAQSNLVRNQKLLKIHIQDLQNVLDFIQRQRKLSLWTSLEPTESSKAVSELSLTDLEHDFQHLLQRAEHLHALCESAMVIAMNSASIAEAKRGQAQARGLFKFTVLASLYVPLSFTSSFMGMNVSEIVNGGRFSIWLFFAITVPIFAMSALFLFIDWRRVYFGYRRFVSLWQSG